MDAKAGLIFAGVLAVVLLILSAMNMGNIGSLKKELDAVGKSQKDLLDSSAKLKKQIAELQDDLTLARTKLAKLETKSGDVEGMAESAARAAAKGLVQREKEAIIAEAVEKAVREVDAAGLKRDVAALRSRFSRMGAGAAAGKAGEKPAAEGRPEATPVAEKIEQGLRDMAGRMGEEAGVELNEEQKKKTADAMGKGITDFFELARQRRNGDITDEEFREKAQELREQTMKGLEGTIGPEQMEKIRKRMEEMRNRRRPGGGDPGGAGGGGGDEAF